MCLPILPSLPNSAMVRMGRKSHNPTKQTTKKRQSTGRRSSKLLCLGPCYVSALPTLRCDLAPATRAATLQVIPRSPLRCGGGGEGSGGAGAEIADKRGRCSRSREVMCSTAVSIVSRRSQPTYRVTQRSSHMPASIALVNAVPYSGQMPPSSYYIG